MAQMNALKLMSCLVCMLPIIGCQTHGDMSPEEVEMRTNRRAFAAEQKAREQAERAEREEKRRIESWLHGTLTCLADGSRLPVRMEKVWAFRGSGKGGMTASHPKTGEVFKGQYTAITQGGGSGMGTVTGMAGQPIGTMRVQSPSRNAAAVVTLSGDKGTFIQLQMQIVAGATPHGIGNGSDNFGNQYTLEF